MKNLLFITYHFPPTGGSGVQRGLKFAKYLPQFGFRPIISVSYKHPTLPTKREREISVGGGVRKKKKKKEKIQGRIN